MPKMTIQSIFTKSKKNEHPLLKTLREKRVRMNSLKEYAVDHGLDIPDDLISNVDNLIVEINSPSKLLDDDVAAVMLASSDKCLRDLTNIVSPAKSYQRYRMCLIITGGIGIAVAAAVLILGENNEFKTEPILALALGLLGAVVYGLFVDIGAIAPEEFDKKRNSGYARLVLGALLGFVLYFAFSQTAFDITGSAHSANGNSLASGPLSGPGGGPESALFLLLPFIAGYSTLLVVRLLARLTEAVEVTLGLGQVGSMKGTSNERSSEQTEEPGTGSQPPPPEPG
jgi:hypothetical protein